MSSGGKVFGHGDVGVHAMTFFKPCSIGVIHAESGDGDPAAVDEAGYAAYPDKTAPGTGADQGAETGFAEIIGEGVTTRAAPAVDQHYLRSKVTGGRPGVWDPIAGCPIGKRFSVQHFDKAIGDLAAAVEAFIDDECFFIDLGDKLADQLIL